MAGFKHIRKSQTSSQKATGRKAYASMLKDMERTKQSKSDKAREAFNRMPYGMPDLRNRGDEQWQEQ